MKKLSLLAFSILAAWSQLNAGNLNLTFTRTGTGADGVAVSASGIDGVSATVTEISHSLKNLGNAAIICPDVNGSTNPTITMTVKVTGLPASEKFNHIGLDIHALNSSGAYQSPTDNKARQWNVTADINSAAFASYSNIDIAAGVTDAHKVWEADAASTVTATNPLTLAITVTKGQTNEGCFFGLAGVSLSYVEPSEPVQPVDPPVPSGPSKFYTIKWKNNTQDYMTEQPTGNIAIGSYSVNNALFWEFIPTDKDDCYYIRSVASGKYIGSCNMTPSSASRVMMSETPVEYYVGHTSSTSGENAGCCWLSSTDCANYDKEAQSARCLNKDGASSFVITWQTNAANNKGSYWTLTETQNLYEPKPFIAVAEIGKPTGFYHIFNANGQSYSSEGLWEAPSETPAHRWYFVGTGNAAGGYQIVNGVTNLPINSGARYKIANAGNLYCFIAENGDTLALAGSKAFHFGECRSSFSLKNQLYQIPCGTIADVFITSATVGSEFRYPMATKGNNSLTLPNGTAQKYVLLSRDAAIVSPGADVDVDVSLNKAAEAYSLTLFADWNRDGFFESSIPVEISGTNAAAVLAVPADAALGKTRLRLRLDSGSLSGADAEVNGQVIDLLLNVVSPSAELIDPTVSVNDPRRGSASWADNHAVAKPKGTSMFLYWLDGPHRIVSLSADHEVAPAPVARNLKAVFSVNLNDDEFDGIDINTVDTDARIAFNGSEVSVVGAEAKAIWIFNVNGTLAARAAAPALNVSALAPAVYIVKAATEAGIVSSKIKI